MSAPVPWQADWAWGAPLIVTTVVFHVFCLGLCRKVGLLIYGGFVRRRHRTAAFTVVMATTTLLATGMHAVETVMWAVTYRGIGALSDFRSAMLYSTCEQFCSDL
jgi:hypothetical protein